ncbi:MAG TPA: helix-turn-helix domain-containing protein [Candidatus Babeliales bacterium]|nr:helix-turn-helix domain-containing protein [Candidatus Babeliales bacterium]
MTHYTQLNEIERVLIYEGKKQQKSARVIAAELGRYSSTIGRELRRNSDYIGYLYSRDAQKRTEVYKKSKMSHRENGRRGQARLKEWS